MCRSCGEFRNPGLTGETAGHHPAVSGCRQGGKYSQMGGTALATSRSLWESVHCVQTESPSGQIIGKFVKSNTIRVLIRLTLDNLLHPVIKLKMTQFVLVFVHEYLIIPDTHHVLILCSIILHSRVQIESGNGLMTGTADGVIIVSVTAKRLTTPIKMETHL